MFLYMMKILRLFQQNYASLAGIEVFSPVSHTLFNPADIIEKVSENICIIEFRFKLKCIIDCYLLAIHYSSIATLPQCN